MKLIEPLFKTPRNSIVYVNAMFRALLNSVEVVIVFSMVPVQGMYSQDMMLSGMHGIGALMFTLMLLRSLLMDLFERCFVTCIVANIIIQCVDL